MNLWMIIGALVSVALVFLLYPLWRDKSGSTTRRWTVVGLLLLLPLVTVGLYQHLGAPAILEEQALTQAHSAYDVDGMITALEDKLKTQPDDAEEWYALGRAYIALQRLDDAEAALAKSAELAPKEAKMIAQYAEAIALKAGSLEGRPMTLVMAALELDYEDEKALELAGLAAYQQENWAQSLHFWRRLLKKLPKESEFFEEITRAVMIAESKVVEASGLGERAKLLSPEKKKDPH